MKESKNMPLGLQKYIVSNLLVKKGVNLEPLDLESELDNNLTLEENIEQLESKYGYLTKERQRSEVERAEEECKVYNEKMKLGDEELYREKRKDHERLMLELSVHKEELEKIFADITSERDPLSFFSQFIAPQLAGKEWERVREGVLLSLAVSSDIRKRLRVHILLHGTTGTGKTDFVLWIRNKLGTYFTNAELTSKVGLTGSARTKEVTPGILAEADGNVLIIDELDKMSAGDQDGLLQACEEGYYTIVKGGHRARFKAEVRVIACANELQKIQAPLLDRFDLTFDLKVPDRAKRRLYTPDIVDSFFKEDDVRTEVLSEYLKWIEGFEPQVQVSDLEEIKKVIYNWLGITRLSVEKLSYRILEYSALRLAHAYAKLKREDVKPEHVIRILELKDETLSDSAIDYLYRQLPTAKTVGLQSGASEDER